MNLKLRSGKSVAAHSSEFQNLVNQLGSAGLKLDDELQALLLLSSLHEDWDMLVISLGNSAPEGKVSMSMVKEALFNEEARRNEGKWEPNEDGQALVASGGRGKNQGRGNGHKGGGQRGGRGYGESGRGGRGGGRGHGDGQVTCFHCHEEGHTIRNCLKFKEAGGRGFTCHYCKEEGHMMRDCPELKCQPKDGTMVVYGSDGELMVAVEDSTDCGEKDWVLDSGCSFHVCGDKEEFWSYEAVDGGTVWMANGSRSCVVGKGIVRFRLPNGKHVRLTDVRHVPTVRKNLISLGVLDEKGYSFSARDGVLHVREGERDILEGRMVGGLYKLEGFVDPCGAPRVRGARHPLEGVHGGYPGGGGA